MKMKRLTMPVVIFEIAALLSFSVILRADEIKTSTVASESGGEAKIIVDESVVFGQILFLYATMALEKPSDLRLCAYEMFRLKPSEQSCRDKYSAWESKEEFEFSKSIVEGKLGGVGLEVSDKEGKVVIVSPIDSTPAFRAGLKSGDIIVKVDNKPVLNLADAVARMRGQPGTPVKVTIKRGGREISFKIVREVIIIHAVSAKIINSPSGAIGYVKVKIFSEIMPEEFRKEITNLRGKGISNIILDFRNNPGGLLDSVLDILSDFARSGDVSIVVRRRNDKTVFDNQKTGSFQDLKAVVIINKGSASASEIFAGAMKDWGFTVVGSRSFGKGVGQTLIPLSNGSMLRLTTFEFLAGNSNTKINDIGVIPTFEISDPAPSASEVLREDRQLEKAIEILSR